MAFGASPVFATGPVIPLAPPVGSAPMKACANVQPSPLGGDADGCKGADKSGDPSSDVPPSTTAPKLHINSNTGSTIDNYTFNHLHTAADYVAPVSSNEGGCGSCGGGLNLSPGADFTQVAVQRIHSLREITRVSSFGPGVFLSYDISLTLFDVNGVTYVDAFNPSWKAARRYSPSGTRFVDAIYDSIKGLVLLDANGAVTVSRTNAVSAVYTARDGQQWIFELFDLDANRKGGRLVATKTAGGLQVLTFAYGTPAGDTAADPDAKWRKASISDLNGGTISLTHTTLPNGRIVVSSIAVPGSRTLAYSYDTGGNLAAVDYPTGDRSTFTRSPSTNGMAILFAEAGAQGTHRNKQAVYTNNIASELLAANTDRPQTYNQASMLVRAIKNGVGEYVWWGVTGGLDGGVTGPMWRRVYEGGNKLRFINANEASSYTSWSVPGAYSPTNPYGAIVATKEAFGHTNGGPASYADLRSGRPTAMVTPDGNALAYKYDASGNMTQSLTNGVLTARQANDARFGKPTMKVDATGKTSIMAYDDAGHMVSRKTGFLGDATSPVGTEIPGLACLYYPGITSTPARDAATPTTISAVDGVALGTGETQPTNYALTFKGSLILDTPGARTFSLQVNGKAYFLIDGQTVLSPGTTDGKKSVTLNLTAGAHTFVLNHFQGTGPESLLLTWAGPETTSGGFTAETMIGKEYLRHNTVAGEHIVASSTIASEEKWEYFPAGDPAAELLKAYVDATGKRTEYAYDSNRRLIQVKETGDDGSLVVMQTRTYDTAGNLASRTDAMGRTLAYAYDARNRLVKTSYGDNTTETVSYGTGVDTNLVVAAKDRSGSVTKFEYDTAGRKVKTLTGYALADNDGAITQTLANPSVETVAYLNGTSDPLSVVRDGKTTEYDYDYKGRVVATRQIPSQGKVLASSTVISADELRFSEADPHGCRAFYAYRAMDKKLVREIRELVPGSLGTLADNAAVLAVTRDANPNPGYAITDYTLDNEGRTVAETDPRGIQTTMAYDAKGRVVSKTSAAGTAQQQTMTMSYDAADRVLAQTDALSRVTSRTYTPAGRVASVTLPDGKTQEFTYYADGKLSTRKDEDGFTSAMTWSQCCGREFGAANPKGEGSLKFFDGPGRVTYQVLVKDVASASGFVNWTSGISLPADTVVSAQTMKYDARGRLIASTKWNTVPAAVDPHNPPIAASGSTDGFTTTYEYFDDLSDSRLAPAVTQLTAQGITLTAGSAVIVTNPTGNQSFSISDGAGRSVGSGTFN